MVEREELNPGQGRLLGVGVGPGDPGLVTVRAAEVIGAAAAVAYPVHKPGASSRALEAARLYLRDGVAKLPLLMPMTRDGERLRRAHEDAASLLEQAGAGGEEIVYLSLGDPLFYSTFGYLAERYPGPVEAISGVTAMSAAAAELGRPLASGDMPTVVVTGKDHRGLEAALDMGGSVVVIKPRSLSEESLEMLGGRGALRRAAAALELGTEKHRMIRDVDRAVVESLPYFSVLWIAPPDAGADGGSDEGV